MRKLTNKKSSVYSSSGIFVTFFFLPWDDGDRILLCSINFHENILNRKSYRVRIPVASFSKCTLFRILDRTPCCSSVRLERSNPLQILTQIARCCNAIVLLCFEIAIIQANVCSISPNGLPESMAIVFSLTKLCAIFPYPKKKQKISEKMFTYSKLPAKYQQVPMFKLDKYTLASLFSQKDADGPRRKLMETESYGLY